jgi:hypothetical protein
MAIDGYENDGPIMRAMLEERGATDAERTARHALHVSPELGFVATSRVIEWGPGKHRADTSTPDELLPNDNH